MKIERFEDIISWQKARILTNKVYDSMSSCRDYSFKDQIQRASLSIMNNIAEGFGRMGSKEFKRFLCIAKGSCDEVQSILYIALDRKYINKENFLDTHNLVTEVSKLIVGLKMSMK